MKIWVNTIVNNEENFIWFAIMSVIDYVDKILIWDSGSTDKTVDIIKEIKKIKDNKISFKEVGVVDEFQFTKMRQKMLEQSKCDWILILDGDEIWWDKSIKQVIDKINKEGDKLDGIVVPVTVAVGDIYHFQDSSAGRYNLLGRKGHFNLRAINRNIPGLHVDSAYPLESYLDNNNMQVQSKSGTIFLDSPYFHLSHLVRSSSKRKYDKFKSELGKPFPEDFKYPEILYKSYPEIVSSPWITLSGTDLIKAKLLTPLRKIKRKFE